MPLLTKKRILLPKLNSIIQALVKMAPDVAILEFDDSDAASKRVRTALIDLMAKEFPEFKEEISNIRMKLHRAKKLKSEK